MSTHPVRLDVVLRLLDHQVVGPDGTPLGKVDDVGLRIGSPPPPPPTSPSPSPSPHHHRPDVSDRPDSGAGSVATGDPRRPVPVDGHQCTVAALLVGVGALGHRWPGRLGAWTLAVWRRLHPHTDPRRGVVPLRQVTAIGPSVEVTAPAARHLRGSAGLELWLQRYVVARLPGGGRPAAATRSAARGGPADGDGVPPGGGPDPAGRPAPDDGLVSLGELLQSQVVSAAGIPLGSVRDVYAELVWTCVDGGAAHGDCPVHPLTVSAATVTHLRFGPRGTGAILGYNRDRHQGPALVGAAVRWLHRHERQVPWADVVRVDLTRRTVTLRLGARPVHPLDAD